MPELTVAEMRAKMLTIFGSHWRKQVRRMTPDQIRKRFGQLINKNIL